MRGIRPGARRAQHQAGPAARGFRGQAARRHVLHDRRRPRREVPRTRGARQETSAASIGAGPRRRRGRGRAQTSAQTRGTLRQGGAHGGVVGGEEARDARRLRRRRRHPGEIIFKS